MNLELYFIVIPIVCDVIVAAATLTNYFLRNDIKKLSIEINDNKIEIEKYKEEINQTLVNIKTIVEQYNGDITTIQNSGIVNSIIQNIHNDEDTIKKIAKEVAKEISTDIANEKISQATESIEKNRPEIEVIDTTGKPLSSVKHKVIMQRK